MIAKAISGLVVTIAAAGGGTGVAYKVSVKHIRDVLNSDWMLIPKNDANWNKIWEAFKKNNDLKDDGFKAIKEKANRTDNTTKTTADDLYDACKSIPDYLYSHLFYSPTEENKKVIEDFGTSCIAKISVIHPIPTDVSKLNTDLLKNYTADTENKKPELTDDWKTLKKELEDTSKTADKSKVFGKCKQEADKWYRGENDETFLLVSSICKSTS